MIFGSLIQKDLLRKAGFAIPFASLIIIIYYMIFPKNIIQYDISEFFFKWGYHYIIILYYIILHSLAYTYFFVGISWGFSEKVRRKVRSREKTSRFFRFGAAWFNTEHNSHDIQCEALVG